jgi:hypothetical protein
MMRHTRTVLQTLAENWGPRARAILVRAATSSLPALRIVRLFREAGALTPATARPFRAQSRIEELEFRRLLRTQIVRESSPGRYYLDQRMLERRRFRLTT